MKASKNIGAIIVAAGRGKRAGGDSPKQYQKVLGRSILWWAMTHVLKSSEIDHILVVIHPEDHDLYDDTAQNFDDPRILPVVFGGQERQDSVRNGLESLAPLNPDYVLIHDAARPLLWPDVVTRLIQTLSDGATCVLPALPVADTLKLTDEDGVIFKTVPRENLWSAQTPQAFPFANIISAHRNTDIHVTDDIALMESLGHKAQVIHGDPQLLKITTPNDFSLVEALLMKSVSQQDTVLETKLESRMAETRTGLGYDVHAFEAGEAVTLCGISIPHTHKLKGHSDADVALHALTDAILGAIAAGDIGDHFPPSDPQWKGVASHVFLAHAAKLVQAQGGQIVNVDITIICELPKIGPHRAAMQKSIADILNIRQNRVSIKATTTERLGFTGRQEGIAAQAIATVRAHLD